LTQKDPATEREQLEQAVAHLEDQRSILGDAVVDAALASLHEKLGKLGQQAPVSPAAGERRVVTVLFCDVAESTSLAEGMDPEAWADIMNTGFEYLIAPVKQYGGTVANLMGDAILAFFGAPIAHEDDPQRAVLAGLTIVESIKPFREKLRSKKGITFNVRVGINTGLAVVGDVGLKEAAEYTAMGDAVNVAARMEQTAQPGTVQITQDTYALVSPLFEVEVLGGISVKGKSKPVPAYKVLAPKVKPGHLRGLAGHGISSPLIGRENELEVARDTVNRLLEGEGGILTIFGEAGIGKSRLLADLRRSLILPGGTNASNVSQILALPGDPTQLCRHH
jgi:class 3 adenylate cyclase